MKLATGITRLKMALSRALATQHPVKIAGIAALGALLMAVAATQVAPEQVKGSVSHPSMEEGKAISSSTGPGAVYDVNDSSLWMYPWNRSPVPAVVAHQEKQVLPWNETDINIQTRQELIELGLAEMEGGQFQASVAEADDAGHGQLLLQAGFTEQQVRNAQERQREASEEAEADRWFQQMVPITALVELRREGFANYKGRVDVAAADDAGFRDLLLNAGFTELQILESQRRQRQVYEEAMTDLWHQQLAEIQVHGRVPR